MAVDLTVELINATVQIEQNQPGGTRVVGTAFLIDAPTPDGAPRTVLVTAAHVLEKMPAAQARVGWRFANGDGSWRYAPQPLTIRVDGSPKWVRHPERDVAAMSIQAPPEFTRAAIPLSWLATDRTFDELSLGPGDEMMSLGFPRGLSANRAGFPILRSGRVASYPLSPASAFPTFLIDVTVFPGNSGGPVFVTEWVRKEHGARPVEQPFIAGMLTQQVELNSERLEIGVVAHAQYVRETVALLDVLGPDATPAALPGASAPSRGPPPARPSP
jgi:hypothetical protein